MELTDFIICDDIRQENTGKTLLIGVYDEDIKILKNPKTDELKFAQLRLAFLARIAPSKVGTEPLPTRFEVDIVSRPQGQVLVKMAGTINHKMPLGRISIAGFISPLQVVYGTEALTVELRLYDGESKIATFNPFSILIKFIDQLPSG
jgi:hypothetical protein